VDGAHLDTLGMSWDDPAQTHANLGWVWEGGRGTEKS
jgi:hypothetical protein